MGINGGYQQYRRVQVETASPSELILLLYGGAIRFLNRALQALDDRDVPGAHESLTRAQDIVMELMMSLDTSTSVGANLYRIYEYVYRRLVDANVRKDRAPVDEVLPLLRELQSAWQQATGSARVPAMAQAGAGPQRLVASFSYTR